MEQRLWLRLRWEAKPCSPGHLEDTLHLSTWSTRNALYRLLSKGCVTAAGSTHHRRYTATDIAPDDMRGLATASIGNLVRSQRDRVRTTPVQQYRPATALEQAWPIA